VEGLCSAQTCKGARTSPLEVYGDVKAVTRIVGERGELATNTFRSPGPGDVSSVTVTRYADCEHAMLSSNRKERISSSRLKFLGGLAGLEGIRCEHARPPVGIYSSAIACGMISRRYCIFENMFLIFFRFCRATSLSGKVVNCKRKREKISAKWTATLFGPISHAKTMRLVDSLKSLKSHRLSFSITAHQYYSSP